MAGPAAPLPPGEGLPGLPWGVPEIEAVLPHRSPFLLLDRVVELEPGVRAAALKAVTASEPHFAGHFPGHPVMPGVLIIEALAQLGAVCILSLPAEHGKLVLFGGIENARFRRQVLPGDCLRLEIELTARRGPVGRGKARATDVNTAQLVADAELLFFLQARS